MRFYRMLLWKAYLDKGLGLTNYVKYLLAFVGVFSLIDAKTAIVGTIAYVIFCFVLGWVWYEYKIIDTENEIGNKFNPFQREVRRKLNGNARKFKR